MRPWLAKETVDKVNVLGSNYASYLRELIDPEALPKSLGGDCTCAECGHDGKDLPEVGGVDGQVEMGRCAFSSAGPWMVGRKERREGWLKGERDIALQAGELEAFAKKNQSVPPSQEDTSKTESQPSQQEKAESDTSASDSGPSTPALERQLSQVSVHRDSDGDGEDGQAGGDLNVEESAEKVGREHPESRVPQTGDLYVAS